MSILNRIRQLFTKPSAQKIAGDMIEEYQRLLLAHQGHSEYHKKMAQYYSESIERLGRFRQYPNPHTQEG